LPLTERPASFDRSREVKVLVLGGDGFCGWPCAVNLADQGHDVLIVDNLSRRKIDIDLAVESLTPIATMPDRLRAWEQAGGKPMRFELPGHRPRIPAAARSAAGRSSPDAVVHFAEQRAAPYSMKSQRHQALHRR
jgi:UDP-sulfoquinovose synthase